MLPKVIIVNLIKNQFNDLKIFTIYLIFNIYIVTKYYKYIDI